MPPVDVVIVGGGIVGLATARALLLRSPSASLVVLEKEDALGQHQTDHNSGVVHSGIYYEPESWKSRLCRRGRRNLLDFASLHGIRVRQLGKLIVAIDRSELPQLRELHERGLANGIVGLRQIRRAEIREIEPAVTGVAALHVPETAVINFAEVAAHLGDDVESSGGTVLLSSALTSVHRRKAVWLLSTTRMDLEAKVVVTCTGLQSDRVARMVGLPAKYKVIPFEGRYFRLAENAASLIKGLVYPVPLPNLPFLGAHFTRRVDDEVWIGPNAVLAHGRESYGGEWNLRDIASALTYRGFWRLIKRHWTVALGEQRRNWLRSASVSECRRYVPALTPSDIHAGPSGIRAQAVSRDGDLIDDFKLFRRSGLVHVANAPSPAATSSLAIGEVLAAEALRQLT